VTSSLRRRHLGLTKSLVAMRHGPVGMAR